MNIIQTLTNGLFSFSHGKEAFVYIDENISGVDDMLREFGMENVFRFRDGTSDDVINKEIVKRHKDYHYTNKNKKPVIFITKNTRDFTRFKNRNYIIIDVLGGDTQRNENIANFISNVIYSENIYDIIDKSGILTMQNHSKYRYTKSNKIWNNNIFNLPKIQITRFLSRELKKKNK